MSNNNIKPYLLFLLIFNFILSFLCPLQITLVFLLRDRLTFHKLIEKKVLNFSENFYKFFFTDVGISFLISFFAFHKCYRIPFARGIMTVFVAYASCLHIFRLPHKFTKEKLQTSFTKSFATNIFYYAFSVKILVIINFWNKINSKKLNCYVFNFWWLFLSLHFINFD